jgi:subfamily B ATP-binding cassette protein MsbA
VFVHVADLVISGAISKGAFLVLVGYFFQLALYSVLLGSMWILLQEAAAGLGRVFFLMDASAEADPPDTPPLPPVRESVRIEEAHVRYPDGTEAVRGATLDLARGRIVALVGPAGAGKTTLAYLVPRFVAPDRGRVLADGRDVARCSLASLRAQVAFVFQETALFDGSVEENVRAGDPDADDTAVRRALALAGADAFVRELPGGLAARLGRAGARLSAGQKQRIALARALVREAPILILDEPTSALDAETEQQFVRTLRALAPSRMVLVIAHRLSTAFAADHVAFLEAGRIVEQGTPAELLARPASAFRRFVELQTRGAA